MLKMMIMTALLMTTGLAAHAQWNEQMKQQLQEIRERQNPLKCESSKWVVIVDKYENGKRDPIVEKVLNLIAPPPNETWTRISNFLTIVPGYDDGLISLQNNGVRVYLREIEHQAVPSSYAYLKKSALTKLVHELKALPDVYITCVISVGMGARLSGSNQRQ